MPYPLLAITDGITRVDLLARKKGFHLDEWPPQAPSAKGGGVWQDGALSDGRQLTVKRWQNVTDIFTLRVDGLTQNQLISRLQDLRRLLDKATAFWTSEWQTSPVWIEAVAACETNPRYAVVMDYQMVGESNPYATPFFGTEYPAIGALQLALEHGLWQSQPPGTGECVRTTSLQTDWPVAIWSINSALPVGICYAMVQLTTGRLLAPDTNGAGSVIWRTDDGGATPWTASAAIGTPVKAVAQGGIYVYAATLNAGGIYRSADYGATWANVNATHFGDRFALKYRPLDGYMYLLDSDTKVMHRSIDLGVNWVDISGGIANSVGFVIQPNGDIFMASLDGYFYKSTNGTTWTPIGRLPTFITYTAAFCALFNPGDGYIYFTGFSSVTGFTTWRSTDGTSWMDVLDPDFATLTGEIIYSSVGVLYCAKISGLIYRAQAGALSWQPETTVTTPAYSMVERTSTRKVYAGTTGDIWASGVIATVGQTATCESEVFAVNKNNPAQLTTIWRYTVAGAVWDALYPLAPGGFPFNILPAVPAANDIIYFGINTAVANAGPFNNLVFNVGLRLFATSWTIVWEYWNGAWVTIPNVQDGTNGFANTGVNSVNWAQPSGWATTAVNGVTGWWVRARVSAIAGSVSGPQQATRNVYTVNTASPAIAAADVLGDMPALLHAWLTNRSDGGTLTACANRYVLGLRTTSRGLIFQPFLNCSDQQGPVGLAVAGNANTVVAADPTTPTGRRYTHTNPGGAALSTWADQFTFTFSGTLAAAYYGRFRAFLRAYQTAGASGDVRARVTVKYGSGGALFVGDFTTFAAIADWQLLDLGSILFPPASALQAGDAGDSMVLTLQFWSSVARAVRLYDVVLIPTDEWSADLFDPTANYATSGVGNGYLLDLDSVTFPRQLKRAAVRKTGATAGLIKAIYQSVAAGPAMLQDNVDQKLHLLTARYAAGVWYSEPWAAHSLKLQAVFRYLLMRGAR